MFNVLIADDEELERRAIRNIILDNFSEQFIIYEVKNGREAIEIGDRIRPDLVIIDIKMPGINGIEAIKEMHKNLLDTYFIIVTAYDYFNYAKEAIEYNVKQYILKPFKRDEFADKIREAINHLETAKRKRSRELELKERLYSMEPAIRNELCSSIIFNRLNLIDYKLYQESINITLNNSYAMAIKVISNSGFNLSLIREYLEEKCKEYTEIITYNLSQDKIIAFCKKTEDADSEKESEELARKIRKMLREKFNLNSYVGIGSLVDDILNLTCSYEEAEKSLETCSDKGKIVHFNNLNVKDTKVQKNYYGEGEQSKRILNEALDYIRENYNKDITLEALANHVNVSPFYFSKCFKELTGINFIDYLTDYRIKVAKDMLRNGSFNVKEIGYEVGYSDPNYFSRVFKKIEGISPTEYKNKAY